MRGDERGLVARLDDVVGYDFVEGEDGGAEGGAVGVAVGEEEGFYWGGVRGEGGGRRWGGRGEDVQSRCSHWGPLPRWRMRGSVMVVVRVERLTRERDGGSACAGVCRE